MKAKQRPKYKELDRALNDLNLELDSKVIVDLRRKTTDALDEAEQSGREGNQMWDKIKDYLIPLALVAGAVWLYSMDKSGGGWLLFFLFLHGASKYDW